MTGGVAAFHTLRKHTYVYRNGPYLLVFHGALPSPAPPNLLHLSTSIISFYHYHLLSFIYISLAPTGRPDLPCACRIRLLYGLKKEGSGFPEIFGLAGETPPGPAGGFERRCIAGGQGRSGCKQSPGGG